MGAALSVDGLGLTIGGARILNDISLSIQQNETLGIIGPNGAGKTSFFNLLSGIRPATAGHIWLNDQEITRLSTHKRAKLGLARTFQTSSVFSNLTSLENVRIAAQAANGHAMNLLRSAYSFKGVIGRSMECLEQVGLASRAYDTAGSLSHGNKRLLEIAIVLAQSSEIVMLDEPMAGMSAENIPELVEIIRSLSKRHNKTVLIVEHHMDVILDLADRIAVLNYGELLVVDTPEKVMSNQTVLSAYIGEEL